ncbi:MAG: HEAT repeat domain-containing protein [Sandaracinus sp.]|nr:HEAT repeat domain-containing protein [Sandaracinus sp.]
MRRFVPFALLLLAAPVHAQDWGLTRDDMRPNAMTPSMTTMTSTMTGMRPGMGGGMRPDTSADMGSGDTSATTPAADRNAVLIARYRAVLANDPKRGFAYQRIADLFRERDGSLEGWRDELRAEVGRDPNAYAARMLLGHVLVDLGRPGEARESYEAALALRADDPTARVALGALLRSSDPARARELYEGALEHTRDDEARSELLRELGELALDADDYEAAQRFFGRLGGGAAGSVFLKTELARALVARRRFEQAIAEYERVLGTLRGDNRVLPPVLRELAEVQLEAARMDDAIATLDRALRLAGPSSGVRRELLDVMVEAYRRAERLPELAEKLERARDFDSVDLLGRVRDELGDSDAALEAYRRALRLDPRSVDTRVRLVRLLSRSGRLDEVVGEYRELVRVAPRESRFVVELAQLLMQTGQREEALRLAAQTGQRNARDASVQRALAELYAGWGEDELATRALAALVRLEPRDPAHLVALGEQQLAEGDEAAALATWRRIVAGDARGEDHATLAAVLADHDFLDEAEARWRDAVRADESRVEWVRGLAAVLERPRTRERPDQRRARDEEAVRHWQSVMAIAREEGARREARQRIVGIWSRRRELPDKVREWRQRFDATPPDIEAGRYLAEAYLRQRPRAADQAEAVLRRITELEPGDVESLKALERAHTARGDLAGAIEVLRRLVQADPRHAASYLQRMASHAHALYRDAEAVEFAAAAVERAPDDAEGHRRLGDLHRQRQDVERAIRSYSRAIELDDRLFATYFDLAELHLARGEVEEAARLYRVVLRTCPDDDFVARAGRGALQIHLGAGTLEELERDVLPLALAHARRPIFRRLVVELYDSWVPEVARRAERGDEAAAAELRRIAARSLKPLLEALADPSLAQRRIAVDVLGRLESPNAAGPLLASAESDDGPIELRVRALLAAGAVASPSFASRLLALAKGPERRLREAGAWGLARIAEGPAVEALRSLLDEGDPGVRAYGALGLGRAQDRRSAARLELALREDRSVVVQAAAAWSLGQLAEPAHVPALRVALRHGGLVSRAAAQALGMMASDARAAHALTGALFEPDAELREAAAAALRGGRPDERLPIPTGTAQAYLAERARVTATEPPRLAPLRDGLLDAAREALHGPLERVLVGIEVLTPARDEAGPVAVGALTRRDGTWTDETAATVDAEREAIGAALVPDLVALAAHPAPEVRARVANLLGRARGANVAEALARLVADADETVARRGLEAVDRPHVDEGLVAAVEQLAQTHAAWSIRLRAVEALVRMQQGRATLARALTEDEYAFVREAAARGLVTLGAEPTTLAPAANDPEPRVRDAATPSSR